MTFEVTRTHGAAAAAGTLYTNNCNLFTIVVKDTNDTIIDLRFEDTSGGDAIVDKVGVAEAIIREINPLAYFIVNSNTGVINVVVDLSIDSAAELQTRIRSIGKLADSSLTSIGPNSIDISHTTVTVATSLTLS